MRYIATAVTTAALLAASSSAAHAFCGFYVSGAGADMFNNATQVVLMREGTRTVLSMQNNYQGPPENFAMVVPVPMVLQKENVKTLDKAIFTRLDQLAAPRLVEYWERDPCAPDPAILMMAEAGSVRKSLASPRGASLGVTIEAQFTVGEYEIVVLSAKESTGLDTWLRREKYQIPQGAEPLLRPYVESGMKFFVAKVNTEKVKFQGGMAKLSPLRFYYDSDEFALPIRLGMINSAGTQDLIVHILARGQRYEAANYKNVTIPTNLTVKNETRTRFGEFYAALFDRTLKANPGAVVTEYAWDASSCDPCPTPALNPSELATLGSDVLYLPRQQPSSQSRQGKAGKASPKGDAVDELVVKRPPQTPIRRPTPNRWPSGFVLTRLHARYQKGALADDLVFKAAPPIAGGREMRKADNALEEGATPARINNFQARYAIRHAWTGPIACANPRRGMWGGPPDGRPPTVPQPALDLAFAPRGKVQLASFVAGPIPGLPAEATAAPAEQSTTEPSQTGSGAAGQGGGSGSQPGAGSGAAPAPPSGNQGKPASSGCQIGPATGSEIGSARRAHGVWWVVLAVLAAGVARPRGRRRHARKSPKQA